jgi:hypothetical protein
MYILKMKNHYYSPYVGNKRSEIKNIMPLINFDNITTIIEPFAGSSAMSYYISTQYPKRFKYILNDNDKINIELYKISRDPERTQMFNNNINKIIDEWNTYTEDVSRKAFYNNLDKNKLEVYIFKTKYTIFRMDNYPPITQKLIRKRFINVKAYKLQNYPVYDFFNNEDIIYECIDAVDFIKKHSKDDGKLFLLDPPYLSSCNVYYNNFNMDIYEWISNNKSILLDSKNKFIFTLEKIIQIKEMFKEFKILLEYGKEYMMSKKNTTHIVYSN